MNRKFIVSAVLSLGILAGMVALFPAMWVLLLAALLVLVSAQVVLVRRHLHVTGPAGSAKSLLLKATRVPAESTALAPGSAAAAMAAGADAAEPAQGAPEGEGALPFDGDVFSRFREHLESAERTDGAPRGAAMEGAGAPDTPEVRDQVRLSTSTAHRPPVRKPAPPPATATSAGAAAPGLPAHPRLNLTVDESEEEVADLFSDLVPEPIAAPKPAPLSTRPSTAEGASESAVAASAPTPAPEQGSPADEDDAAADPAAEIAALVKLAEDALGQEDRAGAKAALSQAFSLAEGLPEGAPWPLHRAAAREAALNGDPESLIAHFESMLKAGAAPELSAVPALVTRLLGTLEGEQRHGTEVSLLMRLLAQFRQAGDRPAMDSLYGMIEAAQEQVGDERKLLQYLKNHLEIRKVLGDREGQLELIDQIGNRCYKLGLTAEAQHFYELGLKLRNAPQSAADPDADTVEASDGAEAGAADSDEDSTPAESALPASANSGRNAG